MLHNSRRLHHPQVTVLQHGALTSPGHQDCGQGACVLWRLVTGVDESLGRWQHVGRDAAKQCDSNPGLLGSGLLYGPDDLLKALNLLVETDAEATEAAAQVHLQHAWTRIPVGCLSAWCLPTTAKAEPH